MARMTLKAARINAGLTQKVAAKEIGVSNKTLGLWEAGVRFPKANKIDKICDLYGLGYNDIIFLAKDSL